MVHVLAVGAVKEAELLLPVGRIVRGVEVEQNLPAPPHPRRTRPDEPLHQLLPHRQQFPPPRPVLPSAQRRLRAQRALRAPPRHQAEHRVRPQPPGVIGVLVPADDLIHPLPQQGRDRMLHLARLPAILEARRQPAGQPVAPVELPQRQQPAVTAQLPAVKPRPDPRLALELKRKLWFNTPCHLGDAPQRGSGFAKTQCSCTFVEHPLLLLKRFRE
jgi:hypothetical protein